MQPAALRGAAGLCVVLQDSEELLSAVNYCLFFLQIIKQCHLHTVPPAQPATSDSCSVKRQQPEPRMPTLHTAAHLG